MPILKLLTVCFMDIRRRCCENCLLILDFIIIIFNSSTLFSNTLYDSVAFIHFSLSLHYYFVYFIYFDSNGTVWIVFTEYYSLIHFIELNGRDNGLD